MRQKAAILGCLLLLIVTAASAQERKYAFLVGVETYDPKFLTRLNYAEDDATQFAEALERLGFDVILMTSHADLPSRKPNAADKILDQLTRRLHGLKQSDTIVVAFSGHGVQFSKPEKLADGSEEQQFFCPEEANLTQVASLVSLGQVYRLVEACPAERKLLIVDACRNDALSEISKSARQVDLAPAGVTPRIAPKGTLAVFSCSEGQQSFEDRDLKHGVFCYHLLKYLTGQAEARYDGGQVSVLAMADYASTGTRDFVLKKLDADQLPELVARTSDWPLGSLLAARKSAVPGKPPSASPGIKPVPELKQRPPLEPVAGFSPSREVRFELARVPANAVLVTLVRPSGLVSRVKDPQVIEQFNQTSTIQKITGIDLGDVEYFLAFAMPNVKGPSGSLIGASIVRTRTPEHMKRLVKAMAPQPEERRHKERAYYSQKDAAAETESNFCLIDPQTLVYSESEEVLFAALDTPPDAWLKASWAAAWQDVRDADIALAVDTSYFAKAAGQEALPAEFARLAPLWEKGRVAVASMSFLGGVKVEGRFETDDAAAAQRAKASLESLIADAKTPLSELLQQAGGEFGNGLQGVKETLAAASSLLNSATIEQRENAVYLHAQTAADGATPLFSLIVTAVAANRQAANETTTENNLRRIGIAMNAYANANGHLPPAVVLGPDGKTLHSWRVELLPYLDRRDLYEQYRPDEAWNSEQNRKVLAQMPAEFRHPEAPADSTSAFCYVLVGPQALFDPEPRTLQQGGPKLASVRDGLSNTIMVVEAKRDVPWTRPQDLPYDPARPLPKLGGYGEGWSLLFADGVVRRLAQDADEAVIRAAITPTGSESAPLP